MTDLVVATPVFLDLTFVGLESLPALGEERFAAELLRSPGGGAITAVGAARLGLSTAIAAPLGDDVAGDLVRAALAEEQRRRDRDARGAADADDRRAAVRRRPRDGHRRPRRARVRRRRRRRHAAGRRAEPRHALPRSRGRDGYVTCGDDDARAFRAGRRAALAGARALFVNRREALALTGAADRRGRGRALAELAESVVVTLGDDGGLIATGGADPDAPTERVDAPVDTTGAGDLLVAAYIWADLRGADAIDRLRWAVLYASLGVTTPTGIGGAQTEAEFVAAGTARGLRAAAARWQVTGSIARARRGTAARESKRHRRCSARTRGYAMSKI